MPEANGSKQNTKQLEQRLKSAVDALIPNVFDKLDLSIHPEQRPPVTELPGEARLEN